MVIESAPSIPFVGVLTLILDMKSLAIFFADKLLICRLYSRFFTSSLNYRYLLAA